MAYLVLAYPDIRDGDYELIQRYRKGWDKFYYSIVEPHFTFVFPVFDVSNDLFADEIISKSKGVESIEFVIRCATISKNAFNSYFHTFLVPDEGYSKIVKLHDKLYSGLLQDNLRLDIDFIPHIGIGSSTDKFECKQRADEWNQTEVAISGVITHLTIVNFENNIVTKLKDIELERRSTLLI